MNKGLDPRLANNTMIPPQYYFNKIFSHSSMEPMLNFNHYEQEVFSQLSRFRVKRKDYLRVGDKGKEKDIQIKRER
jgi:hypothetical protein